MPFFAFAQKNGNPGTGGGSGRRKKKAPAEDEADCLRRNAAAEKKELSQVIGMT